MAPKNIWLDNNDDIIHKFPSGKGERTIICHLGSAEIGLLRGFLLHFGESKSSKSANYHTEMDSDVFLDWLERNVSEIEATW